jgi:dTDP-4-dehydrorhamnose 3,5-epimerase-like enzyme
LDDELAAVPLPSGGDARGVSFSLLAPHLSRIGDVRDVHIASVGPGHVRGNHFHARHRELICVVYRDTWSLHWDTGEGTATHTRTYSGSGAVLVSPPTGWSHAIRNDGAEELWLFAVSDAPYDPDSPDATPRVLAE